MNLRRGDTQADRALLASTHRVTCAAHHVLKPCARKLMLSRQHTPPVRQADAFSYGVVLWELITKEQTSRGNWRPVRVPDECPAAVEALIADCLTDDVERRPSMKEVVERLVALRQPQPAPPSVTDSAKEVSSTSDSTLASA